MTDADAVLAAVARAFDVPLARLVSHQCNRDVARARHAAAWVMHERGGLLKEIAPALGWAEASSAWWGVDNARKRMKRDPAFKAAVDRIEREIT